MEDKVLEVVDYNDEKAFSSIATDEPVKKVEITVTAEEQEMIFKGTRPENMRYDVFCKVRKDLDRATRLYKGGKYKHVSVWMDYVEQDGSKMPIKRTKTYIKDTLTVK